MNTATPSKQQHEQRRSESAARQQDLQPYHDAIDYVKAYAREKPEVAALWCFGLGFVTGWKLKLW